VCRHAISCGNAATRDFESESQNVAFILLAESGDVDQALGEELYQYCLKAACPGGSFINCGATFGEAIWKCGTGPLVQYSAMQL
jgi:hypothetical protein